jgi:hypothetical protein
MGERIAAARRALRYVPDLEAQRLLRVWFPGCGMSLAPRSYSELGFDVVASDLSREALDAQWQSSVGVSAELLGMLYEQAVSGLAPERGGKLVVHKHDLREPFEHTDFDCVLNIRAFAGFDEATRALMAQSHGAALRPGGWAIFEAGTVALSARDELEAQLEDAGLVMPLIASERWYRRALADTGLDVVFVLGHPRPRAADRADATSQPELDAIEQAYLQRRREQRAREGEPPAEAKLAFVLYD